MTENTLYQKIGNRISYHRNRKGLSQAVLAKKLGYKSQTAVSYFENGNRRIKIPDLQKVARVLEIPINFLLSDTPFDEKPNAGFLWAGFKDKSTNSITIERNDFSKDVKFSVPKNISLSTTTSKIKSINN